MAAIITQPTITGMNSVGRSIGFPVFGKRAQPRPIDITIR
jgi:hypothetical protein